MRLWIEVFNTGDLRHLLIKYDGSIDNADLSSYFDTLMQEYEVLRGGNDYNEHLHKVDDTLYKEYVIRVCYFIITCIKYGEFEGAERLINEFNLKMKLDKENILANVTILKLEKKIKQLKTTLEIKSIQEKEENKSNKKTVWEDKIVFIEQSIGVKVDYDCTVALCVSYEKQAERTIKVKNKR